MSKWTKSKGFPVKSRTAYITIQPTTAVPGTLLWATALQPRPQKQNAKLSDAARTVNANNRPQQVKSEITAAGALPLPF